MNAISRRSLALLLLTLTTAGASGTYKVQPGDNLSVIARRTGLSLGQLRAANQTVPHLNRVRSGSLLRVPDAHKPAAAHTVRSGETLSTVAQRYHLSLGQLLRANPRLSAQKPVQAGKRLYIPARRVAAPRSALAQAKARGQLRRDSHPATSRPASSRPATSRPASIHPASSQPRPLVQLSVQQASGWQWPVRGWISSGFGERSFDGDTEMHYGIDIVVPEGTAVRASRAGRVIEARADFGRGWGWTITVDHGDGWKTRYAHLSRLAARSGDRVNAGQVIGRSGNSGRSTGPHLHYGTYQGGVPKNPLALLD
ncbi:peptidoglycan DD-metalloendopeptidase family protein [Deinococcus sp.]|uniref:peptidoglycan DD-metalloendopeptidase family protein n=1 Tax=Deinococcus sp. TaxID=47478 RepID=UPI0025DAA5CE|nr:peptidoglycan DD-metalloendopeptidase family protein [Deinococcus sp.]